MKDYCLHASKRVVQTVVKKETQAVSVLTDSNTTMEHQTKAESG